MNKVEKYTSWTLIDNQPKKMIVDGLHDDEAGLRILLKGASESDESLLLQVLFDSYISYRNMDESYRAGTFDNYPEGLSDTFYTVSKSTWLDWFHKESKNIYNDRGIIHYSIITVADCIDILSEFPPDVSWIKKCKRSF
ncbi:MAG: hypothetical protein ABW157_17755 [Candidatus Thiodiazotropha sp. LLP2]